MVLDEDQAFNESVNIVGGKAYALAAARKAGAPVPDFFVVTAECANKKGTLKASFKPDILTQIKRLSKNKTDRFAVRSSAVSEDSLQASHAGQFLTLLEQKPDTILSAIEAVFKSGLADHVKEYRSQRGLGGSELPCVVIQRQIEARASGVAFSADPVSGRRDRIVISAVNGLGESLVSGEEDGENWLLGKVTNDIYARPLNASVLNEEEVKKIAALCLSAENRKQAAQDIEWTIDKSGKVWHLQDRPITSPLLAKGHGETLLTVLDNSNIVESYPGFVSPLTFSFASQAYDRVYRAFLAMVGTDQQTISNARSMLSNMLVCYDGRMYYNLGNWYRLLSFLPFFSKNRSNMESMMGVSSPIPEEAISDVKAPSFFALIRMIVSLSARSLFFPHMRKNFYKRMKKALRDDDPTYNLDTMSLSELGKEYRRLESALLDRWDAPILNDVLCMMAYGGSRKYLQRHAGQDGIRLHNDVMIGQGDIISAEPAKLIREAGDILKTSSDDLKKAVADFDIEKVYQDQALGNKIKDYIKRFGDRRVGELKLESPTLDEDPTPLLSAIYAASMRADDKQQQAASSINLDTLFAHKPIRKQIASLMLKYAKARVKDRENLRFERTRIFARARRIFLRIGQEFEATARLDNAKDIFFLDVSEILGSIEGFATSHNLKGLVHLRKTEQADYETRTDPGERILLRGGVGDKAARLMDNIVYGSERKNETERRGLACGSGKVKARVRVVRDPLVTPLELGEVLVARNTDPGWISHFVNASAVVVERGSILSHSAIVSRELGIPCVVGVKGACSWLKDGDLVEVDGGEGIVRKCDK